MEKKDIKQFIIRTLAVGVLIVLAFLLLNIRNIMGILGTIIRALKPFIFGGCMAYILAPLCNKLRNNRHIYKHKSYKTLSIALTEIIFISILLVVCITVIPQSITSIYEIVKQFPTALDSAQDWLDNTLLQKEWVRIIIGNSLDDIKGTLSSNIKLHVLPNIDAILNSTITNIKEIGVLLSDLIIGVFVSIFALANKENFAAYMNRITFIIFGDKVSKVLLDEVKVANKMFTGFFIGKIIDSLIVGVICLFICGILDMPYTILISVIVCITNIVPIVGPFIGAIPSIIIILSVSPIKAVYFTIFIIILQQLDGHYIGPKCIGGATGLSTFWVLFAIIFFGHLWGILGMIVGVPLLAIIFDIIKKITDMLYTKRKRKDKLADLKKDDEI